MSAMSRHFAAAVIGVALLAGLPSRLPAQVRDGSKHVAAAGSLRGVVHDDQGTPIEGAMVSALGATTAVAVSSKTGEFELAMLSPGPYLLRVHLKGHVAPRAQLVQVLPNTRTTSAITLQRTSTPVLLAGIGRWEGTRSTVPEPAPSEATGTAGDDTAGAPAGAEPKPAAATPDSDDWRETAWRLRHARRGILKDVDVDTLLAGGIDVPGEPFEVFESMVTVPTMRTAAGFLSDIPFSGQVNLLTTGSFDSPQQLLDSHRLSHGIAYLRLGAAIGGSADWTVRGAFTEADITSWIVAGSYTTRAPARHRYDVGLSYSAQRYDGGNPLALRTVADGSRNAGVVHGFDTFAVTPMLTVTYGGRYATYDYLDQRGLFSPRVDVTVTPGDGLRLTASASRRAHAPGAEEFLPPGDGGIWLPPQRTFSAVESTQPFQAQRSTSWTAGAERDFGVSTVSARVFAQRTENQLVAIFGADLPNQPAASLGHYQVANAGDADAVGYTLGFKTVLAGRVHGAVDYSTSRARLEPAADLQYLLFLTPSVARPARERLHDVTTSIEASVPETATRVLVLYRIGNGYAQPAPAGAPLADRPRVDSRFDVQVRQALPFLNFSSARWEMLLAVRNYFRETGADQVVYDELLVVRPPKRIVGGVTMHF